MKYSHASTHRRTCRHDSETRAQLGYRLRMARCNLSWSVTDAGKYFQVTERTWHNWENGAHRIPYAVYKLMRVLAQLELPGAQWAGWSLQGGKLITPENHEITPQDGAWWSLMIRKGRSFTAAYQEARRLRGLLHAHGIDAADGSTTFDPRVASTDAAGGWQGGAVSPGLVPYKTSRDSIGETTPTCSQDDVIITSWPILYDSPPPLTHLHAPGPSPWESASTPCFASPWMPTCDLQAQRLRPIIGPHLASQTHLKQLLRPPPPKDKPKLQPKLKAPKLAKLAIRPQPGKGIPAPNGSSSPVKCAKSAKPSKPTRADPTNRAGGVS